MTGDRERVARPDAAGRRCDIRQALQAQRDELRASIAAGGGGRSTTKFPRSLVMQALLARPEMVSTALLWIARALRLRRAPDAKFLASAVTLALLIRQFARKR